MASVNGPANNGSGGNQPEVGNSIGGSDDIIRIDPGAIDTASAESGGSTATHRAGYGPNGRKLRKDGTERAARQSGNASAGPTTKAALPVDALAGTIVGVHALLSATLKVPELALDPKEGAQLAAALANLQRFYPVHVTEKALAWGQVFTALGMIYGTRIAAVGARRSAEKKQGDNVIRPQAFQRPPQPTVQQPQQAAPTSPVQMPDGDDLATAKPQMNTPRPPSGADQVFVNTPPHLM